jgi:hypothetical protein
MKEVEPEAEIKWDTRDAILFYVPGISKSWARVRTKDESGLDLRLVSPPGAFNLSRVEKFGATQAFGDERASDGSQVLQVVFLNESHLHPAELREFLKEHLSIFRERFGAA